MSERLAAVTPPDTIPATVPFQPAWWLPGPHAQTLGARFTRPRRGVALERERVELPDGDFVDLDWAMPPDGGAGGDESRPLVLVLHGLEGSARSRYALELYRLLARRHVQSVGLNFRSCSGELNRNRRLYHSGDTGDVRYVLAQLRSRFPHRRLGAVGVSIGGNVLLKLLGEDGPAAAEVVSAAAAVSVPYDLSASAAHMESGFAQLYVRWLLRTLRAKVRAKRDQIEDSIDLPRALAAGTFWEFDDAATAPLHGFASADEYYERSSSRRFLDRIGVPTRLVHAVDDPFLPEAAIPYRPISENPCLEACISARGGHVGFVTGPPWAPRYWAEHIAADYLAHHLHSERA